MGFFFFIYKPIVIFWRLKLEKNYHVVLYWKSHETSVGLDLLHNPLLLELMSQLRVAEGFCPLCGQGLVKRSAVSQNKNYKTKK